MAAVRNAFGFLFTMTVAGISLIVTGVLGYDPPTHMSLDPSTWRRGDWTADVLPMRVELGVVFLIGAAIVAHRINRRLAPQR